MPSANTVHLIGNLTRDPELRYTPNGTAVTDFSLAINNRGKDGQEETLFIEVTAWQGLAEIVCQHLNKGNAVYVLGRLHSESWQDKDSGQKRFKLKVVAERIEFLTKKEGKQ